MYKIGDTIVRKGKTFEYIGSGSWELIAIGTTLLNSNLSITNDYLYVRVESDIIGAVMWKRIPLLAT